MGRLNDKLCDLLIKVKNNDKKAEKEFLQRTRKLIISCLISMTDDYSIIDDVVQDAFVQLIPTLPKLQPINYLSYIRKLTKFALCNYVRKFLKYNKIVQEIDDKALLVADSEYKQPGKIYEINEYMDSVETAIRKLCLNHRNVINLAAYRDYGNDDIAWMTGVPKETVNLTLHKARVRLANQFPEHNKKLVTA